MAKPSKEGFARDPPFMESPRVDAAARPRHGAQAVLLVVSEHAVVASSIRLRQRTHSRPRGARPCGIRCAIATNLLQSRPSMELFEPELGALMKSFVAACL